MECELRQCMSQAVSQGLSLSAGLMQKSRVTLEVHVNGERAKGQKGAWIFKSLLGGEGPGDHEHSFRLLMEVL